MGGCVPDSLYSLGRVEQEGALIARDEIRALVDAIPEERLGDARAALAPLADPVYLAFLNAPEDDEPVTEEDLAAIAEAKADVARGDVVSLEEAERLLLGRG